MTRRAFAAALTCGAGDRLLSPAGLMRRPQNPMACATAVLEAVYGARLPTRLRLPPALASSARYFEVRAYAGSADVQGIFARAGLRAYALGRLRFLIPFDSLEERSRSWDRFNSDPEWARVRAQLRLVEITIFAKSSGHQPGGRIFEMSL